jgi:hypothetical protein
MLVETILRFTLGVKDHRITTTRFINNELWIELDVKKTRKLPCSVCGKQVHVRDKLKKRCWRYVSPWGILVFLSYSPLRIRCPVVEIQNRSVCRAR